MQAEIQVKTDTTQSVQALAALEQKYIDLMSKIEGAASKVDSAAEKSGNSLLSLGNILAGGAIAGGVSMIMGKINELNERARESAKLWQQMQSVSLSDLTKINDATANLVSPEKVLKLQSLFQKYGITATQTADVLKYVIQTAREQGGDVNQMADAIAEGVISGSRDTLENYGIIVTQIEDKEQQRLLILDQFKEAMKGVKIEAKDYYDMEMQYHNKRKQKDVEQLQYVQKKSWSFKKMWNDIKDAADAAINNFDLNLSGSGPRFLKNADIKWAYYKKVATDAIKETQEFEDRNREGDKAFEEHRDAILQKYKEEAGYLQMAEERGWSAETRAEAEGRVAAALKAKIAIEKEDTARKVRATEDYIGVLGRELKALKDSETAAIQTGHVVADGTRMRIIELNKFIERLKVALKLLRPFTKAEGIAMGKRAAGAASGIFSAKTVEDYEADMKEKNVKKDIKLSEDQIYQMKKKALEQGKLIEFTEKEYKRLAEDQAKIIEKEISDNKKAWNEWKNIQTKKTTDLKIETTLYGDLSLRKIKLEKDINEEIKKGKNHNEYRLNQLNAELKNIKDSTDAQGKLEERIKNVDTAYGFYRGLIQNKKTLEELEKLELQRGVALSQKNVQEAQQIQQKIVNIYKLAEVQVRSNAATAQMEKNMQNMSTAYSQFYSDEQKQFELTKLQVEWQEKKNSLDEKSKQLLADKITALKEESNTMGMVGLKMKEWEQNNYGAYNMMKNVWQGSADAFLMSNKMLKEQGKTRGKILLDTLKNQIYALGKENFFKGGTRLAEAYAAGSNPATAAMAPGLYKSALTHFLVAGLAGIGSAAFGAFGGSGSKKDKEAAPTSTTATTSGNNITRNIYISQSMLLDGDDFVRKLNYMENDYNKRRVS